MTHVNNSIYQFFRKIFSYLGFFQKKENKITINSNNDSENIVAKKELDAKNKIESEKRKAAWIKELTGQITTPPWAIQEQTETAHKEDQEKVTDNKQSVVVAKSGVEENNSSLIGMSLFYSRGNFKVLFNRRNTKEATCHSAKTSLPQQRLLASPRN